MAVLSRGGRGYAYPLRTPCSAPLGAGEMTFESTTGRTHSMTTTTDPGIRVTYGPPCEYCGAPMAVALAVAGIATHPGCPEPQHDLHEPNDERTSR